MAQALIDAVPDPPGFRRRRGNNQYNPRITSPEGFLSCGSCKRLLEFKDFHKDSSNKYGYAYFCKDCACSNSRKNHKIRQETSPKFREQKKNNYIKHRFGITLTEYNERLVRQDYKCAICGDVLIQDSNRTHLDHCHKTNLLREFLCIHCNVGIGSFFDSIPRLTKAIEYLKKWTEEDTI